MSSYCLSYVGSQVVRSLRQELFEHILHLPVSFHDKNSTGDLISKITFQKSNGEKLELDNYNLVDVTNNSNLTFIPVNTISLGTYTNVSFTFGFDNNDNTLSS